MKKQGVARLLACVLQGTFVMLVLLLVVHLSSRVLGQSESNGFSENDPNVDVPLLNQAPMLLIPATPTATPSPTPTSTPSATPVPTPTITPTPSPVCSIDGTLAASVGASTGILQTRMYRPGSPTATCAGVTPPSPFNSGRGPFIYDVHYITNHTASALCTTVSLNVLTSGTVTTRMEVSAFQAPFVPDDITNPARYLGDAGKSVAVGQAATSFQLTVPANSTIALVVVNVEASPAGLNATYRIDLDQALCGAWAIVGAGDFNGDSHPDYLLYNRRSSQTAIWYMNNNARIGSVFGPSIFPTDFRVVGVGDFNSDSHPDYLLYNARTRNTAIWYMNNNTRIGSAFGPSLSGRLTLVGVADFNGDSKPDYLLLDPVSHATEIWYLNNNVKITTAQAPALYNDWTLVGVADFNGDSKPDYLLYGAATRKTVIWYMNNHVRVGSAYGPTLPTGWSLVGVGDFNGDTKPDYLLYNASSHQTAIWYIVFDAGTNQFVRTGSAYGPNLPPD